MITSMGQLNQEASISRNATGADAALQNQIDLLLSDGPFNPPENGIGRPATNSAGINRWALTQQTTFRFIASPLLE